MRSGPAAPPPSRTAPPRPPDGFPLADPRYRRYLLFTATGIFLALDALILIRGVEALGEGPAVWNAFLDTFRSTLGMVVSAMLVAITLFFSMRWLRVESGVPTVRIDFLPAPPTPLILVGHFGAFVVISALILLVLGGIAL
jgi:fumarate reductase subunit C